MVVGDGSAGYWVDAAVGGKAGRKAEGRRPDEAETIETVYVRLDGGSKQ